MKLKKKRLLWMYYGGTKSPPNMWEKIVDFLPKAALKCPCFTVLKFFFSFINHRNFSDRVKCVILKSLEIDNKSDIGALKLEIVLL